MRPPVELSIIVPCYNEAENVIELAERARAMFEARGLVGEVVFVDDASTDHTGALIDGLAARYDFVRAVHHDRNQGIVGGWESGVQASSGRCVAIMDGDLQYLPEDVYRLYRQLKHSNADVVQGWRSHIGRPRDFRYAMSRVLHVLLRVLFAIDLYDIKSGFLICEREVFAHILRRRFSYHYFQTFIVVSAYHKGYRIEEIESLFEDRKSGESFISALPVTMVLRSLSDLAKGFIEFRVLSRRTDILGDFLAQHPRNRPAGRLPLLRRLYLRAFAALMPLHHWKLSSTALRYYYQLRRSQWLGAEEIGELQEARLRLLVTHAHRHAPYYREMFQRLGIDPDEIRHLDDLQRLPILSPDTIRRNLHFDLMSDSHDKRQMLPISTSGSNGEPLRLYAERTQLEMRWATSMRNAEWTGYRFGDRQVRLWDVPLARPWLQALRERLDAALARRAAFPGGALDGDALRRTAEFLRRHSGVLVQGDAATLQLIGSVLEARRGSRPRVRGVIPSGQTLSAAQRAALERAFRAPVFDRYGSRAFSTIAHECDAHGGYHVNAESYIVEIVRDGRPARPGESGDVLVTDLSNYCVPLIRYATGDRAVATDRRCACGRGLPLIESIDGRRLALIVGVDGRVVPGTFFTDVLSDEGHLVRQFQILQSEPGALQLRIVKGPRFSETGLHRLLDLFRRHLGAGLVIDVETVPRIPPDETGAHSPVLSRLSIADALTAATARAADGPRGTRQATPRALDRSPAAAETRGDEPPHRAQARQTRTSS